MILPVDAIGTIISFALDDSDRVEKRLCPFAQVNKVWYEASLSVLQNKTNDYIEQFIERIQDCSFYNSLPAIIKSKISLQAPYSCTAILDFRRQFKERFEPLQELEIEHVEEMARAAKTAISSRFSINLSSRYVFLFGPIVNKNLKKVQAKAIFKDIEGIGYSAYPSKDATKLILACDYLRYLGCFDEAVKIAATLLCEEGKGKVMREFCNHCLAPEWRIDILAVAQILWPEQEKAHLMLKKIAYELIHPEFVGVPGRLPVAFHLMDILGGDKIWVDLFSNIIKEFVELNILDRLLEVMKKIPYSSVRDQVLLNAVKALLAEGNKSGIDLAKTITNHMSWPIKKKAKGLIAKKEDPGCTIS